MDKKQENQEQVFSSNFQKVISLDPQELHILKSLLAITISSFTYKIF